MSSVAGKISVLIITLLFMAGIVVYMMSPAQAAKPGGDVCGTSPSNSFYNEGSGNCDEGDTSASNPETGGGTVDTSQPVKPKPNQ